jgi:hypothetical protein
MSCGFGVVVDGSSRTGFEPVLDDWIFSHMGLSAKAKALAYLVRGLIRFSGEVER